jgi:lysine 2,3-aminomutase
LAIKTGMSNKITAQTGIMKSSIDPDLWSDWEWQDKNAIRTVDALSKSMTLSSRQLFHIEKVSKVCPFKITPYYFHLIDQKKPNCPIRKIAVPDEREMLVLPNEMTDPIGDTSHLNRHSLPSLVHRYPDRVLLFPTNQCGIYCRHCFRKWRRGDLPSSSSARNLSSAISYIKNHPDIKEVILSGGDPLTFQDENLFSLLSQLKEIAHIKVLRIHTRMPVVNPFRITNRLAEGLSRFRPIWLVTHFNHPKEMTETASNHISLLLERGIPLLNQTVLLKGVNTDADTLRELSWRLIEAGIQPYYLHHLDCVQGLSHFRVSIDEGMYLIRQLQGTLPGYAIPKYMLDIPGGHGKVPLQYPYLRKNDSGSIVVESPKGEGVVYEDIVKEIL